LPRTVAWHDPGQYAWQNTAHGERMLLNQRQAIDARMKQYTGQGSVRSAAPGTTFTLAEHPEHDLDALEQRKFLITAITHEARNVLQEAHQVANLAEFVHGEQIWEEGAYSASISIATGSPASAPAFPGSR
jgi:type VI secretion system secreted protein VgrG